MKVNKAIALAALVFTATAGLALPSQAAPFFNRGNNYYSRYNRGMVPPPMVTTGYGLNAIDRQIQRGLANGSLTRGEADKLFAQQAKINNLRARLASNGLSFSERQRINNDLARLEANIRRDMTNNRTSYRFR